MINTFAVIAGASYVLWFAFGELLSKYFPKIFGPVYRFFQRNGLTFSGKVFGPKPRRLTPMMRFRVALNTGEQLIIDPDPRITHKALYRNRAWVFQHNLARRNSAKHCLAYCSHLLRERSIDPETVIAIRLDIRNVISETDQEFKRHDFYWDLLGDPSNFEHTTSFV